MGHLTINPIHGHGLLAKMGKRALQMRRIFDKHQKHLSAFVVKK